MPDYRKPIPKSQKEISNNLVEPFVNPETGETKCWEVKTENYRLSGPKKGSRIGRNRRNTKFTDIINMIYVDLKTQEVREGVRYEKSIRRSSGR